MIIKKDTRTINSIDAELASYTQAFNLKPLQYRPVEISFEDILENQVEPAELETIQKYLN